MSDVYLLDQTENTLGPFDPYDVDEMLVSQEIQPTTYAFCAGMPDWRSVREALVWARRELAKEIEEAFLHASNEWLKGGINPADVRLKLRNALWAKGVVPSESEIESLFFLLDTNTDLLRRWSHWEKEIDPEILDAFPATELHQFADLRFPRDWQSAWMRAGGRVDDGRMVARKDDPVWLQLSDFGYPFPPFSMEFAVDMRDVDYADAIALDVVDSTTIVRPSRELKAFESLLFD